MGCPFCAPTPDQGVIRHFEAVYLKASTPALMPGHMLIIPKRHITLPEELFSEERSEIMDIYIKISEMLRRNPPNYLKARATRGEVVGCDLSQHTRPFLPENWVTVRHLHFHLKPRWQDDEFYLTTQVREVELFKKYPRPSEPEFVELTAFAYSLPL